MAGTSDLLTAGEVAARLRVNRVTVYRWADEGSLRSVRLGRRALRFRVEDVDDFIAHPPGNGATGGAA